MKITEEVKISSKWDPKTKTNDTNITFSNNATFLEVMTAIELGKKALNNSLENYVKSIGGVTEEELEELLNKPLNFLTNI